MVTILRAVLFVGGLFFLLVGFGFLFDPGETASGFGLRGNGIAGHSTLRADLSGYFLVLGFALSWGAWKRNGDLLLLPAALMAIAFIGRAISLLADGAYDGWFLPMIVEAVATILALIGSRVLPHHALGDDEGLPG